MNTIKNVSLSPKKDSILVLDQRKLPGKTQVLALKTMPEVYDAIRTLAVRGAPAIGITAGYAYYLAARERLLLGKPLSGMGEVMDYLASSRPTAVNLVWALQRMDKAARSCAGLAPEALLEILLKEAEAIRAEDAANNRRMAEFGLSLLKEGDGVLTHCNAGWLATSEYGTATGPLYLARERGMNIRVFADETRPLLQGARLTAYELMEGGVDVTLICEGMASQVMKNGWVNAVFVGCDRAARNGDCANKIGTASLGVLAKHYGVPMYFFVPTSTIDMGCPNGGAITIEEREGRELTELWYSAPMAPRGVKTYNPAFDVTDHELITAIVTEHGVVRPPFEAGFQTILKEKDHV